MIEGAYLPDSVRLSIFVSFLARLIREEPQAAVPYAERFGLAGESPAYLYLAELYGDFDRRQKEAFSATMPELSADERRLFARALQEEKHEFIGATMGKWFKALESAGEDTKQLTNSILRDSDLQMSIGFSGNPVSPEDLEERARTLELAFEAEFGRPFQAVVGASE